jgi:hypothetical protein
MKNIIRNCLIVLFTSFILINCVGVKYSQNFEDYPLGTSMKIAFMIDECKDYQIDSLIKADTLPNIKKWMHMNYMDYETNKKVLKRMYIRTYENGNESTYIIIGDKEPYKVTKRITN